MQWRQTWGFVLARRMLNCEGVLLTCCGCEGALLTCIFWGGRGVAPTPGPTLRLFYGCSCRFHPSGNNSRDRCIKASRALARVCERALGCFARSPKSPPARRCVTSSTCQSTGGVLTGQVSFTTTRPTRQRDCVHHPVLEKPTTTATTTSECAA